MNAANAIQLAINFGMPLGLLCLGLFVGRTAEKRHQRNLDMRESENGNFLVTEVKSFPGGTVSGSNVAMVVKEVVIATDYLKSFLAGLRKILGGEVRSYETLLDRARREATQRIVEQAKTMGHNAICNLRLETSIIGGITRRKVVTVGIVASGTAYTRPA